ncbi:MAG: DegT/DnrJ/EryC1/StrS family aminotransferase [Imperialibacter sp.]|uniref:DegT/DnrJ/EryC1/StrS family aminotransferase n=1 Tax=Imperialibacter sp. TaxID=2038411 RepID=UPI0032EC7B89
MGTKELDYIKEAFDSNWIAPVGPCVNAFEGALQRLVGVPATAISSGTAGIHLALIIAGVERGDEVICQSFTFCGSSNPILYQGATPVFVDSELDTWNMDPALLEEAIVDRLKKGRKPRAIIYVHLYGMPAKGDEIRHIADKYDIFLIEDAAEALGATYKGRPAGSLGDISVLSFNGNKIITTSGGGALLSPQRKWVEKATYLATQARQPATHYEHTEVGYNYRMSNICASIGRGQLEVLEERVQQRRANYDFYKKELSVHSDISFLSELPGHFSNRWLTTILVNPEKAGKVTREDIRLALEKQNIECRPTWKPMHMQPVYNEAPKYLNGVSERVFKEGLCLPSGSNLTLQQKQKVIGAIHGVLKQTSNG